MNHTEATPAVGGGRFSTGKRTFARHLGEMVLAMFLGMGVLAGLAELLLATSGSSLGDQSVGLQVTVMGVSMTVPMVAWMSYRGHAVGRAAEMAAAMMVPSVGAAILGWAGVLEAGGALALQHVVMIPAMLGVMLWRYEEYAHPHAAVGGHHAPYQSQ